MRRAGAAASSALFAAAKKAVPGATGREVDGAARTALGELGARPAAELVYDFPGALSVSVDDEAAHAPPSVRALLPGDLVKLDLVAELHGYYADCALSLALEPATTTARDLVGAARATLASAIASIRPDGLARDLGGLLERLAADRGYATMVELAGHGIGRAPHEAPDYLECFDNPSTTLRFERGMVLAVEVFLSAGSRSSELSRDGWTIVSSDASLVAQAEVTLVVNEGPPEILTPLEWWNDFC